MQKENNSKSSSQSKPSSDELRAELDGLRRNFEELRRTAIEDQEELQRMQKEAASLRNHGTPAVGAPQTDLAEVFQNLAASLNHAVSSKQMRFEDVEKSFKSFHGKSGTNVVNWIEHFGNQADLFELNSFQRFA